MFLRKRPFLLPANRDLRADLTGDLDDAFADMVEACFASPVLKRTELAYKGGRYPSPGALLRANLITRGQWLLTTVEGLDAELENGGMAQFMVNKFDWLDDVTSALQELQLNAFLDAYVEIIGQVTPLIDGFKPSANRSMLSVFRDTSRLERQLRRHTDDSVIDRNFRMRWDEASRSLVWDDDQWSRQMKKRMIAWVADHPEEFREQR